MNERLSPRIGPPASTRPAGTSRPRSSSTSWPIRSRCRPDRFGVDIKTTPFLSNIFRRLVAVCLKHGAVPIGGMATALPNPDPEVNRVAAESIKADKVWEAEQGFIRAWVAHIFHMKTAADPFKQVHGRGTWRP
ncbi:MAG: hypothetical protein HC774_04310 [Sphingomonadales bacterium]|nr:hypothetical protein [Sphingomonadales bacterium]